MRKDNTVNKKNQSSSICAEKYLTVTLQSTHKASFEGGEEPQHTTVLGFFCVLNRALYL